jgi:hypothetical protein
MQINSMKPLQYLLPSENVPLLFDRQSSTDILLPSRELPPLAALQRQEHSAALGSSSIVDMSNMQPISASDEQFMDEILSWSWRDLPGDNAN